MKTSDFEYHLPKEMIAQHPAERRNQSRLLVMDRETGETRHLGFSDFPGLLRKGDLLILNDTKVFAARLLARKQSGAKVEIFLLDYPEDDREVRCLARPGRKVKDGDILTLEDGSRIEVRREGESLWTRQLEGSLLDSIESVGITPLPPYIERVGPEQEEHKEKDRERYQTVYADKPGAVAAPTAGLHFDDTILQCITDMGIRIESVTLHVGPGTFQPVRSEDIAGHRMEEEWYTIPEVTAAAVNEAKGEDRRVVAVGTTVVRTLESAAADGRVTSGEGSTELFIYPGYGFQVVDALLTNFHLPRSTLLMLVCTFAGRENVLKAYREAVQERYRFYSYGDAMFIA
jgi:S-adenosylmethionine:tRNA ribosyltransferase-isomerase